MTHWPDVINGTFEAGGGLLLALNCRRLRRDKRVAGVSLIPVAFYAAWGFWNLAFYPFYGAWLSFFGGIGVVAANTVWLAMALYYRRKGRAAT